jgi:hypothetical protein
MAGKGLPSLPRLARASPPCRAFLSLPVATSSVVAAQIHAAAIHLAPQRGRSPRRSHRDVGIDTAFGGRGDDAKLSGARGCGDDCTRAAALEGVGIEGGAARCGRQGGRTRAAPAAKRRRARATRAAGEREERERE